MSETNVNPNQLVYLEGICTLEHYEAEDGTRKQVLHDISMEGCRGESWVTVCDSAFEMRLLVEIMANARPYQKGRCILNRRGMRRKKKVILPHVFYIGSTNMLFERMSVLEYVMMLTAVKKKNPIERQKEIFENMIETGLGYIGLSSIYELSPQEKAIVTLFSSLYLDSEIIIMNLARLMFQPEESKIIASISSKIRAQNKIFIFSTLDLYMAQLCATHGIFLHDGKQIYAGKLYETIEKYDRRILHIEDSNILKIYDVLNSSLRECTLELLDKELNVYTSMHKDLYIPEVYRILNQARLYPAKIVKSEPELALAWKEVKKEYDLSK